jgi:cytochrome c-type biogenesis protein CcmH
VVVILALLLAAPAFAVEPDEVLPDAALEQRAREISAVIRCVVCQNQSIDDSNAEIARDMRRAIRERLTKGDSDAAVVAFLRARYGDYVLLRPPFDPRTWALWLGPPLLLLLAGYLLYRSAKGRAANAGRTPVELTAAERRRLDALLEDDEARR